MDLILFFKTIILGLSILLNYHVFEFLCIDLREFSNRHTKSRLIAKFLAVIFLGLFYFLNNI